MPDLDAQRAAMRKLDGLLLLIEGVGRTKSDGTVALQALGVISFDDEQGVYCMRAFNDGRLLETQVALDRGEWTELAEIMIGAQAPKKLPRTYGQPASRRMRRFLCLFVAGTAFAQPRCVVASVKPCPPGVERASMDGGLRCRHGSVQFGRP